MAVFRVDLSHRPCTIRKLLRVRRQVLGLSPNQRRTRVFLSVQTYAPAPRVRCRYEVQSRPFCRAVQANFSSRPTQHEELRSLSREPQKGSPNPHLPSNSNPTTRRQDSLASISRSTAL